jgi:hypothetical protein
MDQPTFSASRGKQGGPKPKGRVDDNGRECTKCGSYKRWGQYDRAASGYFGHDSICKRCKADRLRDLRAARLAALPPEEWTPPTSGCESNARYTEVMPLQYGIYVHRCWVADGSCVYVGRTRHVPRRLGGHALVAWWRDVDHVDVACMTVPKRRPLKRSRRSGTGDRSITAITTGRSPARARSLLQRTVRTVTSTPSRIRSTTSTAARSAANARTLEPAPSPRKVLPAVSVRAPPN